MPAISSRVDLGQIGQLDGEFRRRRKQLLLTTEVADDQRGIHPDVGRDGAQRRPLVTFSSKPAARRGNDVGARLDGVAGSRFSYSAGAGPTRS